MNYKKLYKLVGGELLLNYCKRKRSKEVLKILKYPEINVNFQDQSKNTALIWACKNDMTEVALKLLEFKDIDYNVINDSGVSALILALQNNLYNVVLKLLQFNNINYNFKLNCYVCCDKACNVIELVKLIAENNYGHVLKKLEQLLKYDGESVLTVLCA